MARVTHIPLEQIKIWQRYVQLRRAAGSFFYFTGIFVVMLSLFSLPFYSVMAWRMVALAVSFMGAALAAVAVHQVDASLEDYLPTDRYQVTWSGSRVPAARPSRRRSLLARLVRAA